MSTRVITVRGDQDISAAAAQGAAAIQDGALVGFATETVYGVAALATHPQAMERLRELKNRPTRPFSVHMGSPQDVARYVREVPIAARNLIRKGLPGPITVILPTGGRLASDDLQAAGMYDILCSDHTIGLRCPDEPVCRQMLSAVKGPVVAPSANLAGEPSPRTAQDVLQSLDGRIDLLIDCGQTRYGKDSTIVLFDADEWKIVRPGVYDERTIRRLMKRSLLFVCTGNTCRSPMAAGLARKMLAQRLGVPISHLRRHGWEVASAGVYASEDVRATPEAVQAVKKMGADISRHRSQGLTLELIQSADVIFCMTDYHVDLVRRLAPQAGGKIKTLDPTRDIPDPIGGGEETYLQTAERISEALRCSLDRELQ